MKSFSKFQQFVFAKWCTVHIFPIDDEDENQWVISIAKHLATSRRRVHPVPTIYIDSNTKEICEKYETLI